MVQSAPERDIKVGWWGGFEDPAVERRFREHNRVRERRLALFSIAIGMLLAMVFVFSDKELFGLTPAFWRLLSLRAAMAAGSALLLLVLRPGLTAAAMDRLLGAWVGGGVALTLAVGFTRPGIYFMSHVFVSLFVLWIFYFAAPLQLPVQVTATLVMVAGHLYMLFAMHADLNPILRRSVIVGYALTTLVAVAVSWNLHHLRRQQFANLEQEMALRTSLQAALAEVRTLQGILPICSYCNSIRDDRGSWQQVEDYVRSHTNVEFSHGICPKCVQRHFAEYVKQSAQP